MKPYNSIIILILSVVFLSCEKEYDKISYDLNKTVEVKKNVTSLTTWSGNKVYVISKEIQVYSILTIEPGAIIKMNDECSISVHEEGKIMAPGTTDNPIVFTSLKDDQYGGDLNFDQDKTKPMKGDWGLILVMGKNSIFENCHFFYATYGISVYKDIKVSNCILLIMKPVLQLALQKQNL